MASPNRVIGVVLLCAHPRNAVYVAKWTFMCPLCGSKMGLWGLFWVNFVVVGAMKFPVGVVSAREGLEMLDMGYARVYWCCSESFCFAGPRFSAFGTFLPQAWGFYVGLCGCFRGALLCAFMWVTLLGEAKRHSALCYSLPSRTEPRFQRVPQRAIQQAVSYYCFIQRPALGHHPRRQQLAASARGMI